MAQPATLPGKCPHGLRVSPTNQTFTRFTRPPSSLTPITPTVFLVCFHIISTYASLYGTCSSLCGTCRSGNTVINDFSLSRQGSSTSLNILSNDGLMESGFLAVLSTCMPRGIQQINSKYYLHTTSCPCT